MKRSLQLSILAVAIVAMSLGQAMAAITLSLNLRYNDPADVTEGGRWDLMAQTDAANGIAGIVAVVDNITFLDNPATPSVNEAPVLNSGIGALPIELKLTGTVVEFVYGQDLTQAPEVPQVAKVAGVGTVGFAGRTIQDDLFGNSGTTYDNFTRIASGSFGNVRPSFVTGATGLAGNEFTNAGLTTVTATDPAFVLPGTPTADGVRGDSVAVDGLRPGDANRDGIVNNTDFSILASPVNFGQANKGWDGGDFNDDGATNNTDFSILASPVNFGVTSPNPSLTAVPEPTSVLMLGMGILSLAGLRRRS